MVAKTNPSTDFDFTDDSGKAFKIHDWSGSLWLFHKHNGNWVSLRKVTVEDIYKLHARCQAEMDFLRSELVNARM